MRGSRQGTPKATARASTGAPGGTSSSIGRSPAGDGPDVMRRTAMATESEITVDASCSLSMGEQAALSGRGWVLGFECSGSSMAVGESCLDGTVIRVFYLYF
jgi:hypothetical protein